MSPRQNYNKFQIIIRDNVSEPEAHGATELARYIGKMLGSAPSPIRKEREKDNSGVRLLVGKTKQGLAYLRDMEIELEKELAEDGFVLVSGRKKNKQFVVMCGQRDRGTLYSIYTFLEKQGCRFFEPYHLGETVPERNSLITHNLREIQNPSLPFRSFDLNDLGVWNIVESTRILDWAVKNKINTIMLVPARNDYTRFLPALKKEIKRRDLSLGVGGEFIFGYLMLPQEALTRDFPPCTSYLYRQLLEKHPDWVKLAPGTLKNWEVLYDMPHRPDTGTFGPDPCLSNPSVVWRITRNLKAFLRYHPEFDYVRFDMADRFGAPFMHCECKKCFRKGKSARFDTNHYETIYFDAVKSMASEIGKEFPNIAIGYIFLTGFAHGPVYSGGRTFSDVPENVKHFYVCLENQSFNYPLFSRHYYRHYQHSMSPGDIIKQVTVYLKDTGRKLVVKEMLGSGYYYSVLRNTPHVVAQNAKWLSSYAGDMYAGQMGFANLLGHDHAVCWHSFGLNLYVYYRLAWNIHQDADMLLDDFCKKYFGDAGTVMRKFYEVVEEKASHLIFDPFITHARAWMPVFSSRDRAEHPVMFHEETDKTHRSAKTLTFYRRTFNEVVAGRKYLEKARALARGREVVDRIEMDCEAHEYLLRILKFFLGLYEAGRFYRMSRKASASRKKGQLLLQAGKRLVQVQAAYDRLNKTGLAGYQGMECLSIMLQQKCDGIEKALRKLPSGFAPGGVKRQ